MLGPMGKMNDNKWFEVKDQVVEQQNKEQYEANSPQGWT